MHFVECLWDFYLGYTPVALLWSRSVMHTSHHCRLSICVPWLCFSLPVSFFSHTGLHKFKWTSLALQAESRVDKVRFHPVSSPLCVYVCVFVRTVCISCGCCLVVGSCWVSPVHQSMSLQWVRATLPHSHSHPTLHFNPSSSCHLSFQTLISHSSFLIPALDQN